MLMMTCKTVTTFFGTMHKIKITEVCLETNIKFTLNKFRRINSVFTPMKYKMEKTPVKRTFKSWLCGIPVCCSSTCCIQCFSLLTLVMEGQKLIDFDECWLTLEGSKQEIPKFQIIVCKSRISGCRIVFNSKFLYVHCHFAHFSSYMNIAATGNNTKKLVLFFELQKELS